MTAEELKKAIAERTMENYKAAMMDCQMPTGALAVLTPSEFYIYTLESRIKYRDLQAERRQSDGGW